MASRPLSSALFSLHLTKPSLSSSLPPLHLRRLPPLPLRCSSTSTPSTTTTPVEFNTTFAPPKSRKPEPSSDASDEHSSKVPLVPWILPDTDGKLSLAATPPSGYIKKLAEKKFAKKAKFKTNHKHTTVLAKKPLPYSKAARRYYNQKLRSDQRLAKALAEAGVASRRKSEELIFEGKVTVNGSVCKLPQTKVDLLRDSVYVNGNRLPKKLPPKFYFALNKPKGHICSDGREPKSVLSLFDDYWETWMAKNPGLSKPRLFTVGRLDVGTVGLIIVTNDGDFAHKIAHPSSNITKEYIVTVEGDVHKKHLISISEGTEIEGVHCSPKSVELLPSEPQAKKRSRLRIVVREGRKHEVRELVANAGLQVCALKRVRIGGYRLPLNLSFGKYVELKPSDLRSLGVKTSGSV